MRNRLLSTPLQHMICTSMTGNTQKPHQHHRPGKEIGPYICVHKNMNTWRCNLYNIWWLLLFICPVGMDHHLGFDLPVFYVYFGILHRKNTSTTKLLEMVFDLSKKEISQLLLRYYTLNGKCQVISHQCLSGQCTCLSMIQSTAAELF